jgi:hypothetical protein
MGTAHELTFSGVDAPVGTAHMVVLNECCGGIGAATEEASRLGGNTAIEQNNAESNL